MISILLKLLEELMDGTDLFLPFLVLLLFIVGISIYQKRYHMPAYMLISVIVDGVVVFLSVVLRILGEECKQTNLPESERITHWIWGCEILLFVVLMLSVMGCVRKYLVIRNVLRTAVSQTQRDSYDHNPIQAWIKLNELKASEMTRRQKKCYKSYRMYLRAKLGNFSANERELKKLEEDKEQAEKSAECHFLRFFQTWSAGNISLAVEHIQKAEELCDADTDVLIHAQILINRGVGYVGLGLYKDADDAFARAIQYCQKHRIHDKELWTTIYYNYTFNKTRLNPDIKQEEWESVLEELKEHLDMEKPTDYLSYFNVEMELLRQTNAGKSQLEEIVYYAFDYMKMCKLPDFNRCMFEASTARIIWAARLNPTYILQALSKDIDYLLKMPMPARYRCFKEIDLFLADLHGRIADENDQLKQTAYWYMMNQALKDLEEYRKSLPAEAVYERCYCFKEIAGLQKRKENEYQWAVVEENFQNAIALYHENGIELEEMICKLDLIDEATGILNVDEYFRPMRKKEMKLLVEEVEKILPHLKQHPIISEIALRLSFYCNVMDDYVRCKKYYELFKKTSRVISLEHYAPWLHRYYMVVCFIVRVLYMLDAVNAIPKQEEFNEKNEVVKTWFYDFGKRDGESEAFIFGRMLGSQNKVVIKRIVWGNRLTGQGDCHAWLVFPQLHLEIDPTYRNITGDDERENLFFQMEQHPMENGTSKFIREIKKKKEVVGPDVQIGTFGIGDYTPVMQQAILEICQMLEENLPPQCPTLQELQNAYDDVMLPVSVG